MLQELDPSVVADVTTCVLQYQELDPNVVAGVVADCTTHPFKRAQTDWLFIPSIMMLSRWDRPGQSAQGSLSQGHACAWLAANAARIYMRATEHMRASDEGIAHGVLWSPSGGV